MYVIVGSYDHTVDIFGRPEADGGTPFKSFKEAEVWAGVLEVEYPHCNFFVSPIEESIV